MVACLPKSKLIQVGSLRVARGGVMGRRLPPMSPEVTAKSGQNTNSVILGFVREK